MPTITNATPQKSAPSSTSSLSATLKALEIDQAPSDSMHHISPFPAPPEERRAEISHAGSSSKRVSSPEPLTANDIVSMRRRAQELCLLDAGSQNGSGRNINAAPHFSPRERELIDMVLRLTDPLPIDPVQLARQADTISNLTTQRDYIMHEIEEERERWRVERDVWERTAEALLSQRVKPQKSEDATRQRDIYETDLRVLRLKLHETQRRLSQYESELQRLKPLLLMQQLPKSRSELRHDRGKEVQINAYYPNSQPQRRDQDKGKKREGDPQQTNSTPASHESVQESQEPNTAIQFTYTPPAFLTKNKPPPPVEVPHRQPKPSRERPSGASKSSKRRHTPLTSDAYVEHFLLAAKRIGRVRATQVSGVLQHAEHEKDMLIGEQRRAHDVKEQERLERERLDRLATGTSGLAYYRSTAEGAPQRVPAAPHTPKKQIHYGPSAGTTPIVFVHTLSPPVAGPSNATTTSFAAAGYVGSPLATSSHTAAQGGAVTGRGLQAASNPPTPLDSLLDAARMMDDGPIAKRRRTDGRGREPEEPESPVPKRRRVSGERVSTQSPALNGSGDVEGRERSVDATAMQRRAAGPDRVRSALDVLADQAAAAFNEPEQAERRTSLAVAAAATKGKGRARNGAPLDVHHEDHQASTSTFIQVDPSSSTSGGSTTVPPRGRARTRGGFTGGKRAPANTNVPPASSSLPQSSSSAPSDIATAPTQPTTSASGRPQRNAAKRNAAVSPEIARGGSRTRGRPRGGAPRRGVAAAEAAVISPGRARVIAPAPRHAPGPDPMPGVDAQHMKGAMATLTDTAASPATALVDVGTSSAQTVPHLLAEDPQSGSVASTPVVKVEANGLAHALPAVSGPSGLDVEMAAPGANEEGETDADAEAEEDLDAEGEQEEDAESEPKDALPRSKSPPPPPPGANSGPPHGNDDNGSDADADAEGEIEFEDADDASAGGSRPSGTQQVMQEAVCASYLALPSPALVRHPVVSQVLCLSSTSDSVTVLPPMHLHIAYGGMKNSAKPNFYGVESGSPPKSPPREHLVKWGNTNHQLSSGHDAVRHLRQTGQCFGTNNGLRQCPAIC